MAANKPELHYCGSCQAQGKQVVATRYCGNSTEQQEVPVMLCDGCAGLPEHEEHYLDEWVYQAVIPKR